MPDIGDRSAQVSRGLTLNYITIGYNAVEAIVSLIAGRVTGSVALVGFGIDSTIEVTSALTAQIRLRRDYEPAHRAKVERRTHFVIGAAFLALAAYVTADALRALWVKEPPDTSAAGITILGLSVIIMPLLAREKRKVAASLGSRALQAEAKQTSLCSYLSAIALAGILLNATIGWWWADPLAALVMVPIIAIEGVEGVRNGP